eukprot:TRINITY_DN6943_c0_g1_i1.p1 TRINITY_DN6943_c0_g1~~TRINITY_DN6943_c0_g1_i1.p1  ORF type:complete len:1039 (-),score=369.21 TRINITY_DN6943_c0_g1_i1:80-3196(-)
MVKPDYYSILGVTASATQVEIKAAYRTLSLALHPDKNPGDAEATKKFQNLAEAYAVLSDPEKRDNYDNYDSDDDDGYFETHEGGCPCCGRQSAQSFHEMFSQFFSSYVNQHGYDAFVNVNDTDDAFSGKGFGFIFRDRFAADWTCFPSFPSKTELKMNEVPDQVPTPKASLNVAQSAITIDWAQKKAPRKVVTHYVLSRKKQNEPEWHDIYKGEEKVYVDIVLEQRTTLQYRVRAGNQSGESEPSRPVPVVIGGSAAKDAVVDDSAKATAGTRRREKKKDKVPAKASSPAPEPKPEPVVVVKPVDQRVVRAQKELQTAISEQSKERLERAIAGATSVSSADVRELVEEAEAVLYDLERSSRRAFVVDALRKAMGSKELAELDAALRRATQFNEAETDPRRKLELDRELRAGRAELKTLQEFEQLKEQINHEIEAAKERRDSAALEAAIARAKENNVPVRAAKKSLRSLVKHDALRQRLEVAVAARDAASLEAALDEVSRIEGFEPASLVQNATRVLADIREQQRLADERAAKQQRQEEARQRRLREQREAAEEEERQRKAREAAALEASAAAAATKRLPQTRSASQRARQEQSFYVPIHRRAEAAAAVSDAVSSGGDPIPVSEQLPAATATVPVAVPDFGPPVAVQSASHNGFSGPAYGADASQLDNSAGPHGAFASQAAPQFAPQNGHLPQFASRPQFAAQYANGSAYAIPNAAAPGAQQAFTAAGQGYPLGVPVQYAAMNSGLVQQQFAPPMFAPGQLQMLQEQQRQQLLAQQQHQLLLQRQQQAFDPAYGASVEHAARFASVAVDGPTKTGFSLNDDDDFLPAAAAVQMSVPTSTPASRSALAGSSPAKPISRPVADASGSWRYSDEDFLAERFGRMMQPTDHRPQAPIGSTSRSTAETSYAFIPGFDQPIRPPVAADDSVDDEGPAAHSQPASLFDNFGRFAFGSSPAYQQQLLQHQQLLQYQHQLLQHQQQQLQHQPQQFHAVSAGGQSYGQYAMSPWAAGASAVPSNSVGIAAGSGGFAAANGRAQTTFSFE